MNQERSVRPTDEVYVHLKRGLIEKCYEYLDDSDGVAQLGQMSCDPIIAWLKSFLPEEDQMEGMALEGKSRRKASLRNLLAEEREVFELDATNACASDGTPKPNLTLVRIAGDLPPAAEEPVSTHRLLKMVFLDRVCKVLEGHGGSMTRQELQRRVPKMPGQTKKGPKGYLELLQGHSDLFNIVNSSVNPDDSEVYLISYKEEEPPRKVLRRVEPSIRDQTY